MARYDFLDPEELADSEDKDFEFGFGARVISRASVDEEMSPAPDFFALPAVPNTFVALAPSVCFWETEPKIPEGEKLFEGVPLSIEPQQIEEAKSLPAVISPIASASFPSANPCLASPLASSPIFQIPHSANDFSDPHRLDPLLDEAQKIALPEGGRDLAKAENILAHVASLIQSPFYLQEKKLKDKFQLIKCFVLLARAEYWSGALNSQVESFHRLLQDKKCDLTKLSELKKKGEPILKERQEALSNFCKEIASCLEKVDDILSEIYIRQKKVNSSYSELIKRTDSLIKDLKKRVAPLHKSTLPSPCPSPAI